MKSYDVLFLSIVGGTLTAIALAVFIGLSVDHMAYDKPGGGVLAAFLVFLFILTCESLLISRLGSYIIPCNLSLGSRMAMFEYSSQAANAPSGDNEVKE